jgi:hypothetical protein
VIQPHQPRIAAVMMEIEIVCKTRSKFISIRSW